MRFSKIVKMFEDGNVCVTGLRGKGKDMLIANVVVRRSLPYVSNVDYGGSFIPFRYADFTVGMNDYKDFIEGTIKYYEFPYPDKTDVYMSDVGVYYPAQFCNELNRDYRQFPIYMALSRQLALGNVHCNVQNLNRAWDKIREQSDQYILCRGCWVFGKLVVQKVRIYELYDSCVKRVPPFRLREPSILFPERHSQWEMERDRYEQQYGVVEQRWLVYVNRSKYDTRIFRTMLKNGVKQT